MNSTLIKSESFMLVPCSSLARPSIFLTGCKRRSHNLLLKKRTSLSCITVACSKPPAEAGTFWKNIISRRLNLSLAVEEAVTAILKDGEEPDLAVVFLSSAYSSGFERLVPEIRKYAPTLKYIFGCTGYGVIGMTNSHADEVENSPALSITLAKLPHTTITLTHVSDTLVPDEDAPPSEWEKLFRLELNPAPTSSTGADTIQTDDSTVMAMAESALDQSTETATAASISETARPEESAETTTGVGDGLTTEVSSDDEGRVQKIAETQASTSDEGISDHDQLASEFKLTSAAMSSQPSSSTGETTFVVLADPTFNRLPTLLAGIDYAFAGATTVGGLVSAGTLSPQRALFAWSADTVGRDVLSARGVIRTGACVLALRGGLQASSVVAQGCRPLTSTVWSVVRTSGDGQRILELAEVGGARQPVVTPVKALQQDLKSAIRSKADLRQAAENLMLGVSPLPAFGSTTSVADYAVRSFGFDKSGALAIAGSIRTGQTLRFVIRDGYAAEDELTRHGTQIKRSELTATLTGRPLPPALGMLLFSCNGRGSSLFGRSSVDSGTMTSFVPVPVAGFLCNGEIGCLGKETSIHSFACAIAILRDVSNSASDLASSDQIMDQPQASDLSNTTAGDDYGPCAI